MQVNPIVSHPVAHTPGPWVVQTLNHRDGDLWLQIGHYRDGVAVGPVAEILHDTTVYGVARLKYLVTPESEQRANAHLIAAAPDLLAALEGVRDTWVRANLCPFSVAADRQCECNYHAAVRASDAAITKARGEVAP